MSRLNYIVNYSNETEHTVPELRLNIRANWLGTPQARIYLATDPVPAFENMSAGSGYYFLNKTDIPLGDYIIEYKDDNGEVLICNITLFSLIASCFNEAGPSAYDEKGVIGWISVTDVNVVFGHTITRSGGTGTEDRSRRISLDGGTTSKVIGSNLTFATWYNDELETIGAANTIPSITVTRESNGCTYVQATDVRVGDPVYDPMTADATATDCTAAGANDGAIVLSIAGGSGNRTYAWGDGPVTQNRSNLAPGTYFVTITDTTTGEIVTIENILISEPAVAAPPEGTLLEFPVLNDLQWVVDPINPEENPDQVTLDNVLFEDQTFGKYQKTCYFQKVVNTDLRIVQFNSDFGSHLIELYDYMTNEIVKSYNAVLKEQNLGVIEDYGIQIRNHVDNPGKSRVYFTGNTGGLPIALSVGDVFEVLNNVEGFNGNYSIVAIENDIFLNTNYIVITLNYTGAGTSSAATGRFLSNSADYNVFEAQLNFAGLPNGKYYAKVSALNQDSEGNLIVGKIGRTEPIHLKDKWLNTNLIEYSNVDNGYGDITWTTGYIGRIRVESIIGPKRLTAAGERGISRNSNYDPVKTYAKKVRGVLFETFVLPPYLHEKLGLIFDCDSFSINGVGYQATEGYADPNYIDEFKLANSSIKLEQLGWNKKYNSNDIGTVVEGGFLMTETGFLKR